MTAPPHLPGALLGGADLRAESLPAPRTCSWPGVPAASPAGAHCGSPGAWVSVHLPVLAVPATAGADAGLPSTGAAGTPGAQRGRHGGGVRAQASELRPQGCPGAPWPGAFRRLWAPVPGAPTWPGLRGGLATEGEDPGPRPSVRAPSGVCPQRAPLPRCGPPACAWASRSPPRPLRALPQCLTPEAALLSWDGSLQGPSVASDPEFLRCDTRHPWPVRAESRWPGPIRPAGLSPAARRNRRGRSERAPLTVPARGPRSAPPGGPGSRGRSS